MSGKSVRFQDLSFIQESEEDQPEDAGVEVQRLHAPSPSQTGGDHPGTSASAGTKSVKGEGKDREQRNTKGLDPKRPAACPFGDRIAQERLKDKSRLGNNKNEHNNNIQDERARSQNSNSEGSGKECGEELPFPRNVIYRQEQEKKNITNKKSSAGVNPSAGKEKGSSFIITRNYLYGVTDNSTVLQPRSVYCKNLQDTLNEEIVQQQQLLEQQQEIPQPIELNGYNTTRLIEDPHSDVRFIEVDNEPPRDINSVSVGIPCVQNSIPPSVSNLDVIDNAKSCENIPVSDSCVQPYKPDSSLSKFVNPYSAPNNQFYGSAAYGLKHTHIDCLTKPDVLKSSCVNQYLHHPKHHTTEPEGSYLPTSVKIPHPTVAATSANTVYANTEEVNLIEKNTTSSKDNKKTIISSNEEEKNNKAPAPNLQFLRDTFPGLDHSQCTSITDVTTTHQHTQKDNTSIILPEQQSAAKSCSGVIGPIVVSPRKQLLPLGSSPGLIIDSNNKSCSSPEPTAVSTTAAPTPTPSSSAAAVAAAATTTNTTTMNYIGTTADMYNHPAPLSRFQEKEELQKLNDRFTSYVTRVRQLGQSVNNVDTSAFLMSTKVLEDEIVNLKSLYESELANLRQEIEASSHERNSLHVQCNKHQKYAGDVQDRLAIETDKNSKLLDEINVLRRTIGNLEAETQDARIASQRPKEEMDQLHRTVENLTRESDQWKHRYDHEQVTRQETEDRLQQLMKKVEFADQVHAQQINDYQARLDTTSASILSLEGKVRELSTADVSVAEMLKQVRETAETELKKYQMESEEQYSRNLSALKAQIDNDADSLSRYQTEKSHLMGNIGELQARIRNLEGQVSNMQHQKQSLEDAIAVERNRSADNIHQLEKKLRDVQDQLVVKMREITNAREANIPLKAEIETLKALMEEEERRLRVPLGIVSASVVQTSMPTTPSTRDILSSSVTNQVLKPRTPPNTLASMSAQPTSVGFVSATTPQPPPPQQQQQQQVCSTTSALSAGTVNLTRSAEAKAVSISAPQQQLMVSCGGVDSLGQALATTTAPSSSKPGVAVAPASSAMPSQSASPNCNYHVTANYSYPPCTAVGSGMVNPLYPYVPSPPLDVNYIPEALDDGASPLGYDPEFGSGDGVVGYYDSYTPAFNLPMNGPRYSYQANPSINRLHVEPSPPISPKQGVNNIRAKSAPATKAGAPTHNSLATQITAARETNLHLVPSHMGNGRDYFEEMFNDLQQDTLFSKARPKSSPLERPVPSTYHDYTVSTSSAIGDLKILEVNQEGKFVRLVNDGCTEFEFGGYMVQQNVGGHPVAVFRFPPRTKFPPDSTVTIWSAMNDPLLHNPPTDFYWKEQQKWGTGPECTTILCRANGQAVAWTTAAHRFTKDAFIENKADGEDSNKFEYNKKEKDDDDDDDEALKELTIDANGPRPEPVYLRREKQQPPTLTASKHPHGTSPTNGSHPHTGQPRPLFYGNDNSSVNRQSRTQTTRPDPIPGQPYAGAPAQRVGSAPLRKMANQGTIRTPNNRSTLEPGETSDCPSPFMRPHSRFESGLEQVQSQHHTDFLPPMPRPPQASC